MVMVSLRDCFSPLVEWKEPEVENFSTTQSFHEASSITQCSRSNPVTPENCSKLILNRSKLKKHCRSGMSPAARKRTWLGVVGVTDADSVLLVKAFGEPVEDAVVAGVTMMGLATKLTCFPSFHLKLASFTPGLERVVLAVHRKFFPSRDIVDQVYAPLVPVLTHLMLHFIDEWEVFALLSHLLVRTGWLDHNWDQSSASQSTLISLLHSHAVSTLSALQHLKPVRMTQQGFLKELTRNWFLWPFYQQPFWIAVRVVDMYLVEGPKILYRLAISALKLFASLSQKLEVETTADAVQKLLCSVSQQQKARWFRDAFAIPRLSWRAILKDWQSCLPNSNQVDETETDGNDSADSEGVDSTRDEKLVIPDPSSELIQCPELWFILWSWLPEWAICREPECLFRASRDGYNLRTLYRKCEDHTCVILMVKSANARVFGAFLSGELTERHNNQFFGNGETFLFSLSPDVKCYKWTAETDLILRANDHELIVGSGGGAYGLWLDSDLNYGSSNRCSAFNNPSLCGPGGQFTCTSIEVYNCS